MKLRIIMKKREKDYILYYLDQLSLNQTAQKLKLFTEKLYVAISDH